MIAITEARVNDAIERHEQALDNPGFCLFCGEESNQCEPDATGYECEGCGEHGVYGLIYISIMLMKESPHD